MFDIVRERLFNELQKFLNDEEIKFKTSDKDKFILDNSKEIEIVAKFVEYNNSDHLTSFLKHKSVNVNSTNAVKVQVLQNEFFDVNVKAKTVITNGPKVDSVDVVEQEEVVTNGPKVDSVDVKAKTAVEQEEVVTNGPKVDSVEQEEQVITNVPKEESKN